MYLEREDHATGLIRLLSIGLRVLTLLEFGVRQRLARAKAPLAGLYVGDIILSAGGQPIAKAQDLQRLMLGDAVGTRFPITVVRRGALVDAIAVLEELLV